MPAKVEIYISVRCRGGVCGGEGCVEGRGGVCGGEGRGVWRGGEGCAYEAHTHRERELVYGTAVTYHGTLHSSPYIVDEVVKRSPTDHFTIANQESPDPVGVGHMPNTATPTQWILPLSPSTISWLIIDIDWHLVC